MQPAQVTSAQLKKMVSYSTGEGRNSQEQVLLKLALLSKPLYHNMCPEILVLQAGFVCLLNRSHKSCCSMCILPLAQTLTKPHCPIILLSVCLGPSQKNCLIFPISQVSVMEM